MGGIAKRQQGTGTLLGNHFKLSACPHPFPRPHAGEGGKSNLLTIWSSSNAKGQDNVDIVAAFKIADFAHAQTVYMRLQRMGITPRNKGNADFELVGQVPFLRLERPAQQPSATELARDAHGTVDVAVERTQRAALKDHAIVRCQHLRNDRRPSFEFVPKRANKSYNLIINGGDDRAKILRDLSSLLRRKFRGEKPRLAFLFGKIRDVIGGLEFKYSRAISGKSPSEFLRNRRRHHSDDSVW